MNNLPTTMARGPMQLHRLKAGPTDNARSRGPPACT